MTIPQVDVCLPLRFNVEKAKQAGISEASLPWIQFSFANSLLMSITGVHSKRLMYKTNHFKPAQLPTAVQEIQTAMAKQKMDYRELVKSLLFTCEDSIECIVMHEKSSACCTNATLELGLFGPCYRFPELNQYIGQQGTGRFFHINIGSGNKKMVKVGPGNSLTKGPVVRLVPEQGADYFWHLRTAGNQNKHGVEEDKRSVHANNRESL